MKCETCKQDTRNPLLWQDVRATKEYRAEEYKLLLCNTCFERMSALHAENVAVVENCVGTRPSMHA
jgi:hypothetical protein